MAKVERRKVRDVPVSPDPEVTYRGPGFVEVAAFVSDRGPVRAQINHPVTTELLDAHGQQRERVTRRQTVADYLRRSGDITVQQHAACRWWAEQVEAVVAAGSAGTVGYDGAPGSSFDPTMFFRMHSVETAYGARRAVERVLEGLGGPDSLPSRLLWACVGLGLGVRQWMDALAKGREKSKHQQHLTGVLRASIEVMTAHAPRDVDKVESQ